MQSVREVLFVLKARGFIVNLRILRPEAAQVVDSHSCVAPLARRIRLRRGGKGKHDTPDSKPPQSPPEPEWLDNDTRVIEKKHVPLWSGKPVCRHILREQSAGPTL